MMLPVVLLLALSFGLYLAEQKIKHGHPVITWIIGILAVLAALGAGTFVAGTWIAGAVSWFAGLGFWFALGLGIAGIVSAFLVFLVVLPQKYASAAASGTVLILAFLIPTLVPYMSSAWDQAKAQIPPATRNIQHTVGTGGGR